MNKIPEGYKPTEVGVIPDDWEIQLLPKIIWFQEGPGLRDWQFQNKGLKVINITNLQDNGSLDLDKTERYISWEECEKMYRHFLIDENDVVMASSGNSYSKTAVVQKADLPLLMNTSVIRFKPIQGISYQFMLVYLRSNYFKMQIDLLITGGAQPNFGPAHLRKIKIPLPPTLSEQTAIATALSDADALIQSLEKIIAKKLAIKQGAMQELLKPKEGWVVKKLGEVAEIRSGGTPSTNIDGYWNGNIAWCTPTDITALNGAKYLSNTSREITEKGLQYSSAEMIPKNSVIMTSRATIGECAINKMPVSTNQGFKNLIPHENVDTEYLYYTLLTQKTKFLSLCSGSTFPEINKTQLFNFQLAITNSYLDQTRIAAILSDIDAEISALETKLSKYKQIKQGMMQNLLTGRIRLI